MTSGTFILSAEYSGGESSLAIHRSSKNDSWDLVSEVSAPNRALENFIPTLDTMLTECSVQLSQITSLITTSGPGSFTGLRCCFASLKAFAMAGNKSIMIAATDELRALKWLETATTRPIRLLIATQMGQTKAVLTQYNLETHNISRAIVNSLPTTGNEPILLSQTTVLGHLAGNSGFQYVSLSAGELIQLISRATTRVTAAGTSEIGRLEPDYYGDRWVKTS